MKFSSSDRRMLILSIGLVGLLSTIPLVKSRYSSHKPETQDLVWKQDTLRNGPPLITFMPDERHILVSDYKRINFLDVETGQVLRKRDFLSDMLSPRNFDRYEQMFTPDGRYELRLNTGIVAGSGRVPFKSRYGGKNQSVRYFKANFYKNRSIEVRDIQTQRLVRHLPLHDDKGVQERCDFSMRFATQKHVVISDSINQEGSYRTDICVVDLESGRVLSRYRDRNFAGLKSIAYTADGELKLDLRQSKDIGGSLELTGPEGKLWQKLPALTGFTGGKCFRPVTISKDSRYVAAIIRRNEDGFYVDGYDGRLYLWDTKSQKLLWHKHWERHRLKHLAFSPDGKNLAVGGADFSNQNVASTGFVCVMNTKTGEEITSFSDLAAGDHAQSVWKRMTGQNSRKSPAGHIFLNPYPGDSGDVSSLAWSPDGKRLCVGYENGDVKLWKVP